VRRSFVESLVFFYFFSGLFNEEASSRFIGPGSETKFALAYTRGFSSFLFFQASSRNSAFFRFRRWHCSSFFPLGPPIFRSRFVVSPRRACAVFSVHMEPAARPSFFPPQVEIIQGLSDTNRFTLFQCSWPILFGSELDSLPNPLGHAGPFFPVSFFLL